MGPAQDVAQKGERHCCTLCTGHFFHSLWLGDWMMHNTYSKYSYL